MNMILTDMSGAGIEHSDVITAFTSIVYSQIKDSICRVYPDNVQYKWLVDGEEKIVIPDATINCRIQAKKVIPFLMYLDLSWKSYPNQPGNMIVEKRWKLTSIGLWIGKKER